MKEEGGLFKGKEGNGGGGVYERVVRDKYDKNMFCVCENIMRSILLYDYYILIISICKGKKVK